MRRTRSLWEEVEVEDEVEGRGGEDDESQVTGTRSRLLPALQQTKQTRQTSQIPLRRGKWRLRAGDPIG